MPSVYMSSTGDTDAPLGPPRPVSRYGSVKKLAPVMVAAITTRVVVGRTPGTVTVVKRFTRPGPVDLGRLVELLGDVLEGGAVEQDVEAELLPGGEQGDDRHRPEAVDQPRRVGGQRPEQGVDQDVAGEQTK